MSKNKGNKRKENTKTVKEIENEIEATDDLFKKFTTVVCVIIFIGLFYLLAVHITNKNSTTSYTKNTGTTYIDYEEILLGSTFNRKPSEYIVVYYDKSNEEEYTTIYDKITEYSSKDDSLAIYSVDMSNQFNKEYATDEESNKTPSDASELKINGTTLIKISKGKVVEYIEGTNSVSDYLVK